MKQCRLNETNNKQTNKKVNWVVILFVREGKFHFPQKGFNENPQIQFVSAI